MTDSRDPTLSRRRFLRLGAGGAALLAGCRALPEAVPGSLPPLAERGPWIDSHVHVWSHRMDLYPHSERHTELMNPRGFSLDAFFRRTADPRIGRAVLVQAGAYGPDNTYLLEQLATQPNLVVGVATVRLTQAGAEAMPDLRAQGVRGIRVQLFSGSEKRIESGRYDLIMEAAAANDMVLQVICEPNDFPALEKLCERHSALRVLIDHFGFVGGSGSVIPQEALGLFELARFPNVHVKASGMHMLGKAAPPYDDLLPLLQATVTAFGAGRVLWGSDTPYQTREQGYGPALAFVRDAEFLDEGDREQILQKNAERLFFA